MDEKLAALEECMINATDEEVLKLAVKSYRAAYSFVNLFNTMVSESARQDIKMNRLKEINENEMLRDEVLSLREQLEQAQQELLFTRDALSISEHRESAILEVSKRQELVYQNEELAEETVELKKQLEQLRIENESLRNSKTIHKYSKATGHSDLNIDWEAVIDAYMRGIRVQDIADMYDVVYNCIRKGLIARDVWGRR